MTPSGSESNTDGHDEADNVDDAETISLRKTDKTTAADAATVDAEDSDGEDHRLSPALIATLVTIPVMVLVGFIAFAAMRSDDDDTPAFDTNTLVTAECARFLAALPASFEGFEDKEVRGPNAVWRDKGDSDDLSVSCGVPRPADLSTSNSSLQVVTPPNGEPAQWFQTDSVEGVSQSWVAVDYRPYVLIFVPIKAGAGPITDVTAVLTRELQAAPLDFGTATPTPETGAPQPTR